MTKEQLKQEFARWILAGRPYVWYKRNDGSWGYVSGVPSWNNEDIYIVDDDHAELRKLQIDKPDTKFQVYHTSTMKWETVEPVWEPGRKYRIKSKIERRWRYASDENEFTTITNFYLSDSYAKKYKYFRDDWYKLENDYIDVLIDKENKND